MGEPQTPRGDTGEIRRHYGAKYQEWNGDDEHELREDNGRGLGKGPGPRHHVADADQPEYRKDDIGNFPQEASFLAATRWAHMTRRDSVFSTSARRFIMSAVIGGPSGQRFVSQPDPNWKAPITTALPSYSTSGDTTDFLGAALPARVGGALPEPRSTQEQYKMLPNGVIIKVR
jgi:hypothetical protein